MKGDYADAMTVLERVPDPGPDAVQIALLLGHAYQGAGRKNAALRQFQRVMRLAPTKADGYVRTASLYVEQQKYRRAFAALDEGLRRVGEPADILQLYETLGRFFAGAENFPAAIECYERIAARYPENLAAKDILANLYKRADQPAKALALFQLLKQRQPENLLLNMRLGDIYEDLGDKRRAEEEYRAACALEPARPEPYLRLIALYLKSDPAKAEALFQESFRRMPEQPALYAFRGLLLLQTNQYKAAIEMFAQADRCFGALAELARARSLPTLYFWYAVACERDGQRERAEKFFELHLAANPEAHPTLNYLAYMWAEQNVNLDKGLDYVQKALALAPENPAYLDTLGWLHYRKGEFPQALEAVQAAYRRLRDDPTICDHLGDIYRALRRDREAVKFWQRSFGYDPANGAVRAKLEERGVKLPPTAAGKKE
jgi:tetratricopeptide (TPR) repeat protein